MKRTVCIILMLFVLPLAACSGSGSAVPTPAPTPGAGATAEAAATAGEPSATQPAAETAAPEDVFLVYDLNGSFARPNSEKTFETRDTVYYLIGGNGSTEYRMYFTDKEYKDWMQLCGRPECSHRSYDCNAYLGQDLGGNTIWPYGEHFYYFLDSDDTGPELWRMKLDGTEHEKLYTCNSKSIGKSFYMSGWSWYFHNKYAIVSFVGSNSMEVDDPGRVRVDYVIDLSVDKYEQKPFDFGPTSALGTPLAGEGDILYCSQSLSNNMLVKANLADMTVEQMTELPFLPWLGGTLRGDILYFIGSANDRRFGAVNVKTGEILFCRELPTMQYGRIGDGIIILSGDTEEGEHLGTSVYDFDFNLIQHIPYEDIGKNIRVTDVTQSYVFGFDPNVRSEAVQVRPPVWYLELKDIGTENLMWRRWEPEE